MPRIKKKGTSGAAKNYITRTQAVKRLQVSLSDFRRLCILKGIFPRQPRNVKKANKGSTAPTTFFYAKDIAYLQHEPVLRSLREYKTFAKKLSRAVGRREWEMAKGLQDNKPVYRLDHIIKERYPTFDDSIKDLDDALSLLMLFANLPSNTNVRPETIQSCARLCAQWQLYVMKANALRKVFLSIKGVYFQAEIRGQSVTWLVPYMFTQHIPHDIDFRIMSTFLELYQTLMGFVLFKLYTDINLVYPPQMDEAQDEQGAGVNAFRLTEAAKAALDGLSGEQQGGAKGRQPAPVNGSAPVKKVSAQEVRRQIKAIGQTDTAEEGADEQTEAGPSIATADLADGADDFVERPSKDGESSAQLVTLADLDATSANSAQQTLFAPYYFYISRECPRGVLEFVLRSFGASTAQIGWDEVSGSGSALKEDDERITHHIVDRPSVSRQHGGKRVYVQPQWVIDCINAKKILGAASYAPGQTLPPHLSPFVDDDEVRRRGGYVPAEAGALSVEAQAAVAEVEEEDEDEVSEAGADEEGLSEVHDGAQSQRPAMAALLAEPLNEDLVASAELEAEAAGGEEALQALHEMHQTASKAARKRQQAKAGAVAGGKAVPNEDEEAKKMAQMLMSNRQRKLYKKLSYTEGKRGEETRKLAEKKQKLVKADRKQARKGITKSG